MIICTDPLTGLQFRTKKCPTTVKRFSILFQKFLKDHIKYYFAKIEIPLQNGTSNLQNLNISAKLLVEGARTQRNLVLGKGIHMLSL